LVNWFDNHGLVNQLKRRPPAEAEAEYAQQPAALAIGIN
jgi:hypothetical protein